MSFIYLNSEKSKILFENYTYNIKSTFKTGEIKWRCCQCKNVTLNAIDQLITKRPNSIHRIKSKDPSQPSNVQFTKCKEMCDIEAVCEIEYSALKDKARGPAFKFCIEYSKSFLELQSKHDNRIISEL